MKTTFFATAFRTETKPKSGTLCSPKTVLILLINLVLILTGFEVKAFTVEPGPGWTRSDERFIYSHNLLVEYIRQNYSEDFMARTGLQSVIVHPLPMESKGMVVAGLGGNGSISLVGISDILDLNCDHHPGGSHALTDCQNRLPLNERVYIGYIQKFNHELFHVIDQTLRTDRGPIPINVSWAQLNPAGFVYSPNALRNTENVLVTPSLSRTDRFSVPHPSFISVYASRQMVEDKAETFSWAMVLPEAFSEAAEDHSAIAGKRALIREMLLMVTGGNESLLPVPFRP